MTQSCVPGLACAAFASTSVHESLRVGHVWCCPQDRIGKVCGAVLLESPALERCAPRMRKQNYNPAMISRPLLPSPVDSLLRMKRRTGSFWLLLVGCAGLASAGCSRSHETTPSPIAPTSWSYSMRTIGSPSHGQPWITHLIVADLDGSGRPGIVACEGQLGQIVYIARDSGGQWTERVLAAGLSAPVHLDAVDMNGNGRLDLLVACMGVIMPNNDRIEKQHGVKLCTLQFDQRRADTVKGSPDNHSPAGRDETGFPSSTVAPSRGSRPWSSFSFWPQPPPSIPRPSHQSGC